MNFACYTGGIKTDTVIKPKYKISVALCCYNGEKYIKEQLESILSQTRLPDEIIICDDNSKDKTSDAVNEFFKDCPIEHKLLLSDKNLGVVGNFERAIFVCSGDIIMPCDQDDIWLEGKIAAFEKVFLEHTDCTVAFCNAALTDENLNLNGQKLWATLDFSPDLVGDNKKYKNYFRLLLNRCIVTGTAMAFKSDIKDKMLPMPQSWIHDGWITILESCTGRLYPIDECLLLYRQHSNNVIGAQPHGFKNRLKRYLNNFTTMDELRNKRRSRYNEVLRHLNRFKIEIDCDDKRQLTACIRFWDRKLSLSSTGFFKGLGIILGDLFNGGYARYYSGYKGAARDIGCLIFVHKRSQQ